MDKLVMKKPLVAVVDWKPEPRGDKKCKVEKEAVGKFAHVKYFLCDKEEDWRNTWDGKSLWRRVPQKENTAMDVVVEQISSEQLMSEEFFLIVFQEESLFELLGSTNVAIQIVWGVVRKNSMW